MAMGDATPTGGYAVSLKTSADSAEGANTGISTSGPPEGR